MLVSELSGILLDCWVARAEGYELNSYLPSPSNAAGYFGIDIFDNETDDTYRTWFIGGPYPDEEYRPSLDWRFGGPIIQREGIQLSVANYFSDPGGSGFTWFAETWTNPPARGSANDELLVAAMRAYVALKFGETVPDDPHGMVIVGCKFISL